MSSEKIINSNFENEFNYAYGTTSKVFTKGKTYYIRVRAYYSKQSGKKKLVTYGDWGNVVKIYIRK